MFQIKLVKARNCPLNKLSKSDFFFANIKQNVLANRIS